MNLDPEIYKSDNYLVLDFETTNLDKGHARNPSNRLLLACWKNEIYQRSSWGNEYEQTALVHDISKCDFIVAHNAKFELEWLSRCGVDLGSVPVFCTQIAEYVILGNRKKPLSLDAVSHRYGIGGKMNVVSKMLKAGVCPSAVPKSLLETYCNKDVSLTEKLFKLQRNILVSSKLLPVMFTRCLVTPVLADIEMTGMHCDTERVEEEYEEAIKVHTRALTEFRHFTGGINPNSPKQKEAFIYDVLKFDVLKNYKGEEERTPKGGRKTGTDVIQRLKAETPRQQEFKRICLEMAQAEADLRVLSKLHLCCEDNGGIIHADLNQTVTQTHRLSSKGSKYKVQFQNIPRKFKRMFSARNPDWRIAEFDGSQLEFRVGAHAGNDPRAIQDIQEGFDIHLFGSRVLGCSRQEAKAHTFKPLYGGFSGPPNVRRYYKEFRRRYPNIFNTQTEWTYKVLNDGTLRTETGLVFHWPGTEMKESGWITNTTNIFNYPIQMLATADIIPIAMVYMWYKAREYGIDARLVNTVHDSTIWEVSSEDEELLKEHAVEGYTNWVYHYLREVYNIDFKAPLGIGIKIGEHWSEGEEESVDVTPSGEVIYR